MGIVKDLLGGSAAKAAKQGAAIQAASADEAINFQREALDKQLALTKPYTDAGAANVTRLQDLITNPTKQLEYIQNNPFFGALAKKASDTVLNNQAIGGRLRSGGTEEALQNSLLLLGNDLLQQNIGNTQNLVSIGANAATGQGNAIANNATQTSDLITGRGAVQAGGLIGAANAKTAGIQNLVNTGISAYALSDIRAKENIEHVGYTTKGFPTYLFNYIGDDTKQINVMAQDVEKIMPEAVIEIDGMKHVNMEMVYGS